MNLCKRMKPIGIFMRSLLNGYMKKCLFMGMLMFIWSFTYVMDNI